MLLNTKDGKQRGWLRIVLLCTFLVLMFPLIIVGIALYLGYGLILYLAIWLRWCLLGRRVMFVYSNSPIWQDYVEKNILPRLPEGSVILNWSERKKWNRFMLAPQAFFFFGGSKEFNPMGVVFRPFRMAKTFRFWEPFIGYKHGKPEALTKLEQDMFNAINL